MLNPSNFELLNVNVSREIFITQDFSFVSTGFHFSVRACFAQATLDEISQDLYNTSEQQLQNDAALQTVSRPASCGVLHLVYTLPPRVVYAHSRTFVARPLFLCVQSEIDCGCRP